MAAEFQIAPGSSVHGIFQGRVLEWVAIAFSGSRNTHLQNRVFLNSHGRYEKDEFCPCPQLAHSLNSAAVCVLSVFFLFLFVAKNSKYRLFSNIRKETEFTVAFFCQYVDSEQPSGYVRCLEANMRFVCHKPSSLKVNLIDIL